MWRNNDFNSRKSKVWTDNVKDPLAISYVISDELCTLESAALGEYGLNCTLISAS